jgi:hypothetical protein
VMSEFKQVFDILFDEGEATCLAPNAYGVEVFGLTSEVLERAYKANVQYFSVNPLSGSRKDDNVTAYRNFLFELDTGEDPQVQLAKVKQAGLPFSTAISSGGKSVHFIVSIDDWEEAGIVSKDVYKAVWRGIYNKMKGFGVEFDRATSNPGRLTRFPGVVREGKETRQTVLEVWNRTTLDSVLDWLGYDPLKEVLITRKDVTASNETEMVPSRSYSIATIQYLPFRLKTAITGGKLINDGERTVTLYQISCELARMGVPFRQACNWAILNCTKTKSSILKRVSLLLCN